MLLLLLLLSLSSLKGEYSLLSCWPASESIVRCSCYSIGIGISIIIIIGSIMVGTKRASGLFENHVSCSRHSLASIEILWGPIQRERVPMYFAM